MHRRPPATRNYLSPKCPWCWGWETMPSAEEIEEATKHACPLKPPNTLVHCFWGPCQFQWGERHSCSEVVLDVCHPWVKNPSGRLPRLTAFPSAVFSQGGEPVLACAFICHPCKGKQEPSGCSGKAITRKQRLSGTHLRKSSMEMLPLSGPWKKAAPWRMHLIAPRLVSSPSAASSFYMVLDKSFDLICLHNLIKWRKYLVFKILKLSEKRTLWTRDALLMLLVTVSHAHCPQISGSENKLKNQETGLFCSRISQILTIIALTLLSKWLLLSQNTVS